MCMPNNSFIVILFLLTILLIACNPTIESKTATYSDFCRDAELTPNIGLIRDNLYQDEKGQLYFRVCDWEEEPIYRKNFGFSDPINNLNTQIDPESWRRVSDTLYADSNTLY